MAAKLVIEHEPLESCPHRYVAHVGTIRHLAILRLRDSFSAEPKIVINVQGPLGTDVIYALVEGLLELLTLTDQLTLTSKKEAPRGQAPRGSRSTPRRR